MPLTFTDLLDKLFADQSSELITERRIKIRINSRGKRTKRITCPPGRILKNVNGIKTCTTPTGRQKLAKRMAIRKAQRTLRAKGSGFKKRANFKRQRAIKRRRQMGIKNGV